MGIFIGYILFSKAYRIFQPQSDKIIVSRDVQFHEDENGNGIRNLELKTIIHNLIRMTWWMINLLGEQGFSLKFLRDAMWLFFNLQDMRKQKWIKNGQMQ